MVAGCFKTWFAYARRAIVAERRSKCAMLAAVHSVGGTVSSGEPAAAARER